MPHTVEVFFQTVEGQDAVQVPSTTNPATGDAAATGWLLLLGVAGGALLVRRRLFRVK